MNTNSRNYPIRSDLWNWRHRTDGYIRICYKWREENARAGLSAVRYHTCTIPQGTDLFNRYKRVISALAISDSKCTLLEIREI